MDATKRIELHCHSCYSERDGVSTVRDLIQTAADIGLSGLALTDHASVSGFGDAVRCSNKYPRFKIIYGMEAFAVDDLKQENGREVEFTKTTPACHVSLLIRNEMGKLNLFRLLAMMYNFKYKEKQLRIPWSEIQKHREGLLIGSACSAGQLYYSLVNGAAGEELEKIAKRFDYLEIQPTDSQLDLTEDTNIHDEAIARMQEYDRRIVELGERLGIPVVVTGNVHFATSEEAKVRSVLQDYIGDEPDNQWGLQLRDTDDMLEIFSYLGKEKAWEVVVENTHRIADKIEDFTIFPKRTEKYYPQLDNAYERLRAICFDKLHELYGENVEQSVLERLKWELNGLRKSGSDSIMLLAKELVGKSGLSPYEISCVGFLEGMLSAFLCGITCVNPLESLLPLYPEFITGINGDKYLNIFLSVPQGMEELLQEACSTLEGIKDVFCTVNQKTMTYSEAYSAVHKYEKKYNVSFDYGVDDWIADCLINVVMQYEKSSDTLFLIHEKCELSDFTSLIGEIYGGRVVNFCISGEFCQFRIHPQGNYMDMVNKLSQKTGINVKDIPLDDADVAAMFHGRNILSTGLKDGIDALGVPGFDHSYYYRSDWRQTSEINSFIDLVRAHPLRAPIVHDGTDYYPKKGDITSQEDIYEYMIEIGFGKEEAFSITEFVSSGKAHKANRKKWINWKQKMLNAGASEQFIWSCEQQIRGIRSRTYVYRAALNSWWCAWFKLHYLKEFYQVYFDIYDPAGSFVEVIKRGPEAVVLYKKGYYEAVRKHSFRFHDEESAFPVDTAIVLAEEMFARGITLND